MSSQETQPTDEPDIIVTAEDLDAAVRQTDQIASFFADPTPKPLPPTALVEAMCSKSRRKYHLLFEETGDDSWTLQMSLDELPATSSGTVSRSRVQSDLVSGPIDWSALSEGSAKCPYCSASSMAKCGRCGRLSCHPDGKQGSPFSCPWCGRKGTLGGRIKSLDGSRGKGKKR
jgi:hypothetical protein